jgi:beta-aspartyl-peptidase (threonine type)
MKPAIVVHSGIVGALFDKRANVEKYDEFVAFCSKATEDGMKILKKGGSALDAIEQAIMLLEDCPSSNAGTGSFLTTDGEAEMDASIMDGETLSCGAVGAIQNVKNPIAVARKVMKVSGHVLLVGAGATKFAKGAGFKQYDPRTKENLAKYKFYKEKLGGFKYPWMEFEKIKNRYPEIIHDTAGAVAIDKKGNIAAGTSAGGTFFRLPGRIGDIPLIGCGTYADNTSGGVSVTGIGEVMIKLTMAKTVTEYMASGFSAKTALAAGLDKVEGYLKQHFNTNAATGLIGIDSNGKVGIAYNSPNMLWAYLKDGMDKPRHSRRDQKKGILGD